MCTFADALRTVVGWGVRRVAGDHFSLEKLTHINLEALDESLTHMEEWFEELYSDTKD